MEKTPIAMRKHIVLLGRTNAGKSTLFNALLGQEVSIVSDVGGTTTDPVTKALELIPYGPVALVDTAGLCDDTELGAARVARTEEVLSRADLILCVVDSHDCCAPVFDTGKTPRLTVYTKCADITAETRKELVDKEKDAVFVSDFSADELSELKSRIIAELNKQSRDDESLLGGLVPRGGDVVLVIPIDSAAPKGRLILPQVQTIRDCLDNGVCAHIATVENLEKLLSELKKIDLVVTDSQAFAEVDRIVPKEIPLTSFSMLLANQKGRMSQLIEGTRAIETLSDGDEVLFLEACTHSSTHEDIGRVKIPNLLCKKTGKKLNFTYCTGYDFPTDIEKYRLAVHCGGCMINRGEIMSRLDRLAEKGIPVTNYGVILAYLTGILDRTAQIFVK